MDHLSTSITPINILFLFIYSGCIFEREKRARACGAYVHAITQTQLTERAAYSLAHATKCITYLLAVCILFFVCAVPLPRPPARASLRTTAQR